MSGGTGEIVKRNILLILCAAAVAVAICGGCAGKKQPEAKKAAADEGPVVGFKAPEFSLKSLDGKDVSTADFKGRVVLISFWATWCASCREEMAELNRLTEKFGAGGLTVLGVNVGESEAKAKKMAAGMKIKYTVLLDKDESVSQEKYHLYGLPSNVVIGRDGLVKYNNAALPDDPDAFFGRLLKE